MTMKPYYYIINESRYDENAGCHYFRFDWSHDSYAAVEYYCTNPECHCSSVLLEINHVTPSGRAEKIGDVRVSVPDFRVEEIRAKHKAVYQSKLNKEFKKGIPEEWKSHILEHRDHVKELVRAESPAIMHEPLSKPSIDLDKTSTMGYVEVFGESPADQLMFNHGEKRYLVDEQYCMRPSCDCRQGLLTFIQVEQGKPSRKFVIGYSTNKGKYEVLENYTTAKELEELVAAFEAAYPAARQIISKHYDEMKREGKRAMQEKQASVAAKAASLPGRNDPCSCGSGKKYKKCCGLAGV